MLSLNGPKGKAGPTEEYERGYIIGNQSEEEREGYTRGYTHTTGNQSGEERGAQWGRAVHSGATSPAKPAWRPNTANARVPEPAFRELGSSGPAQPAANVKT